MDPATITTGVISVLTPYLVRGARAFLETAGEVAESKARELLQRLKERWTGDAEASDSLEKFQQKPQRYAPVIEDILHEKIAADPALGQELQALVEGMGPKISIVQKMAEADGVTGLRARSITCGDVSVTQDIGAGKNITGADIDSIG